jgi:hypothetical protein
MRLFMNLQLKVTRKLLYAFRSTKFVGRLEARSADCQFSLKQMVSSVRLFLAVNLITLITHMVTLLTVISKQNMSFMKFSKIEIELEQSLEMAPIPRWNNPFKCSSDSGSIILKEFYQLDCENPFLKHLSQRSMEAYDDVCEVFNEAFDGNENHTLYYRIERDFEPFTRKITLDDIVYIAAACPECHHLQLIDGELFVVERETAVNFQTRSRSIKSLVKQVIDTFKSIGNLEIFIHVRK